jgi:O-antigen/teichoic acid export membrane protein
LSKPTPVFDGKGVASIARNLTFLLGGSGVNFVARFLYAVILARALGPQVYGMINYGIAWYFLFLPLTRMGLEVVLSRDVGKNRQEGYRTAAITLTLRIASITLATAAYAILSWFIEDDPASRLMVFVFSLALIGRSLAMWTENVYTAYEVNQYSFRQQSIFRPLEVALGLLVVIVWREALLVVAIHGLVWCLQAFYGLAIIRRRLFSLRLDRNFPDLRRIFLQGLPLGVAMLLMALPYQGPLIFFRHLASHGDSLGQLALAMQVFFMLSQILFALGSVSLPVLSRVVERGDGKDRVFAETMLRFSLFFGTILALLGTALGPWLTVQIFGERYIQAGTLVGPVLWLMIPWAAGQTLVSALRARKLDFQVLFCSLIGAVFFSLTISEAILRYDALGAIWSAGTGMVLTTLSLIFFLRGHLAMDLCASLIKPGLTALSAIGVFYALHAFGPVLSLLGAFVTLAVGCYLFVCLTPQDMVWFGQPFRWVAKKMSSLKSFIGGRKRVF